MFGLRNVFKVSGYVCHVHDLYFVFYTTFPTNLPGSITCITHYRITGPVMLVMLVVQMPEVLMRYDGHHPDVLALGGVDALLAGHTSPVASLYVFCESKVTA
jgi:hypothetical protein